MEVILKCILESMVKVMWIGFIVWGRIVRYSYVINALVLKTSSWLFDRTLKEAVKIFCFAKNCTFRIVGMFQSLKLVTLLP
jgi:hypothetical protein